jgi:uncharacterized protein YcbK (DUF882 family)
MSDVFLRLKHFSRDEAWGDPDRMSERLLLELEALRTRIGVGMHIVCGTQGAHTANSEHYRGRAVDFVVPDWRSHWLQLFFEISRFDFTGIGYYPTGRYNGKKIGSWHVDVRPCPAGEPRALWIGLHNSVYTEISYQPWELETMRSLGILPPVPLVSRPGLLS